MSSERQPRVFGRRRGLTDGAAIALLLIGFSALAVAVWTLTRNWVGALLPAAFIYGIFVTVRSEVREIELRGENLLVRTLFREYPIPRNHITDVVLTPDTAAIDVLNGRRYSITPTGADRVEVWRAVKEWWEVPAESRGSSYRHPEPAQRGEGSRDA